MIPYVLEKPQNEADFENMCMHVYGLVFEGKANKNGRRGQAQRGVDVYVRTRTRGVIGIQCKKYVLQKLSWQHVVDEVKEADEGKQPISMLLVATTSDSDAALQQKVMQLSEERLKKGKFEICVDFWEDIQSSIDLYPILQDRYAPHAPGGMFQRQEREIASVKGIVSSIDERLSGFSAIDEARADSANAIVSGQLDRSNTLIKAGKLRDALDELNVSGKDMGGFDDHQKARWNLQRGLCLWILNDDQEGAALLFAKAAKLYPGDERMAAAAVRALMLSGKLAEAVDEGKKAAERFPLSGQVWIATSNARVMLGETVSLYDAPESARGDPDVLLFAAYAARQAGRREEAVVLAERAACHENAGFFARETFLAFSLETCTADPVSAQFGLLENGKLARLEKAAGLFEPLNDKLFAVQTSQTAQAAANLGFARLVLGRRPEALTLVDESRSRGLDISAFCRIEIQALEETERKAEALQRAKSRFELLAEDSLAAAAEIAAQTGDADFIAQAISRGKRTFPDNLELSDHLAGLHWGCVARTQGKEKAVAEILAGGAFQEMGLARLCAASRILRWADRPIEAEAAENEARSRLSGSDISGDKLLVAEALFMAKRWSDATPIYEELLAGAPKRASDLHARLLVCHMETGNRGKAKVLLNGLPDGWTEHDDLRRGAMDLGQKVGDWSWLLPLAEHHLCKEPEEASSWLFRLMVLTRAGTPAEFQTELARTPDVLKGTVRTLTQLGSLELRYGASMKGLLRLYRLLRTNPEEPEAYSAYMMNVLIGRMPDIDPAPAVVGSGCHVVFENDEGRQEGLVIDPVELDGMPKRSGFASFDSELARSFIGASVGDRVVPKTVAGNSSSIRVVAIGSAFHQLFHLAHERAVSVLGLPYIKSVHIGDSGDPEEDLRKLHEELSKANGGRETALEFYSRGRLTLSLFMEILGKTTIDACLGWPGDGVRLFVDDGLAGPREEAIKALSYGVRPVIMDASAVAEFARFDMADALSVLGQPMVTPRTVEIVYDFHEEEQDGRTVGTAFDDGGRLGFVEITEVHRDNRRRFAALMKDIVERRCVVVPAYGDVGETEEGLALSKLLTKEEVDTILLAKEKGALLLTLDGRLRSVAQTCYGVNGVWPQAVVIAAAHHGFIPPQRASEFSVSEFLSHRHFVSLRPEDLAWMIGQGDVWMQSGMRILKEYLSSEGAELLSAIALVEGFLIELAKMDTQLGAFGEFVSRLTEVIARRKDCPGLWPEKLANFVEKILEDATDAPRGLEVLDALPLRLFHLRRKHLFLKIAEGSRCAKETERPKPVRVRVLFCGWKPCLILDKTSEATGNAEARDDLNQERK